MPTATLTISKKNWFNAFYFAGSQFIRDEIPICIYANYSGVSKFMVVQCTPHNVCVIHLKGNIFKMTYCNAKCMKVFEIM